MNDMVASGEDVPGNWIIWEAKNCKGRKDAYRLPLPVVSDPGYEETDAEHKTREIL